MTFDPRRPDPVDRSSCEVFCPLCPWVMNGHATYMMTMTPDDARRHLDRHAWESHRNREGLRAVYLDRYQTDLTEVDLHLGEFRGRAMMGMMLYDAGRSVALAWWDVDDGDDERTAGPATRDRMHKSWCPGCGEPDPDVVSPTSCTSCAPVWQAVAMLCERERP
jgi:hypothetical protein